MAIYQRFTVLDFSVVKDYGPYLRGLFRWAMSHLQQGSKVIGKKRLYKRVSMLPKMLLLDNIKTAFRKCTKQQLGAGNKATKRKAQPRNNSLPPGQKAKISPQQRKAGKRVFRKVNNGFCGSGVLRMNKIRTRSIFYSRHSNLHL